jgi:hypothetical protein
MFARLFKTEDDTAQKMLGWFGGYGYRGTMGFFTQTLHIPAGLALLAIALALLTALRGAGALSLDRAISAHLASERRDAVRHGAAESLSHA